MTHDLLLEIPVYKRLQPPTCICKASQLLLTQLELYRAHYPARSSSALSTIRSPSPYAVCATPAVQKLIAGRERSMNVT